MVTSTWQRTSSSPSSSSLWHVVVVVVVVVVMVTSMWQLTSSSPSSSSLWSVRVSHESHLSRVTFLTFYRVRIRLACMDMRSLRCRLATKLLT